MLDHYLKITQKFNEPSGVERSVRDPYAEWCVSRTGSQLTVSRLHDWQQAFSFSIIHVKRELFYNFCNMYRGICICNLDHLIVEKLWSWYLRHK